MDGVRLRELLNKRALGYLSWRRKRRFEHRREVLDALQRDLNLEQVDQLLVTGDLTHIGLPSEFEQARDWLRQLGDASKVALVPGNHDSCVAAPEARPTPCGATTWPRTHRMITAFTFPAGVSAAISPLLAYPPGVPNHP